MDYKERMKNEFHELRERAEKLDTMLYKMEQGTLEFTPSCPFWLLKKQHTTMVEYLEILRCRSIIEQVAL